MTDFGKAIAEAYTVDGAAIDLGRGVHEGKLDSGAVVQVPLRMMNRHGLIAGATGTGKTVTLQTLAEQLSAAGVSVFAADVKGDVSGVAAAGEAGCSTSLTCGRFSPSWSRRRARQSWRESGAWRRRPSACCSARLSASRPVAGTSSSASPSSTSAI